MALLPESERRIRGNHAHAGAARRLAKADPVLRRIIASVGPCTLTRHPRHFVTLCDSIVSQQLSSRVAEVIFERFEALYPKGRPTPQLVAATPIPRLRTAGLSGQKARYLKELARGFVSGRIQPHRFPRQSNEAIIETLTSVHGIGRWTAEMFLMFSLNRLDVLPVDDLGIKKAIRRWYGFKTLPAARTMRRIGRPWHPYETIASWYLWRSLRLD
ncbi:MAG: DNA-3-methyladenine glycosylase family protein [Nitrospiraceae bacterium]